MHSPSPTGLIHFSTDAVPARDRIAYWRDFFGDKIIKIEVEPLDRETFRETNTLLALPDLNVAFGTTNGKSGRRTPSLIADGNDDVLLLVQLAGTSTLSQRKSPFELQANQATLGSMADVGWQAFRRPARYLNIGIPRRVMCEQVQSPDDSMMRVLREDNRALRLLLDYVVLITDKHAPLGASLGGSFASHVHDLIALAVGATHDGAELARGRGVRAARLAAMKADILAHLREEGLSVHDLARRHGVTPRYVQLLFDGDGRTFSEFVVEQRLARAYRMLTEVRFAGWTISAIAFEVGFGNLSYFNRTFRRRYGMTPSDIRNALYRGPR